jgi:TnpA family transposase
MKGKNLPKNGDVITSRKFAFGYYEDKKENIVTIDGKTRKRPVISYMDEDARLAVAAKTGKIPPETITEELGAYDASRITAKFVVEEAKLQGGGTAHGPGDIYPNGWYVRARRLNKDKSYNPKGEVICFYMSGCFTCIVELKDLQVIGKMRMKFV